MTRKLRTLVGKISLQYIYRENRRMVVTNYIGWDCMVRLVENWIFLTSETSQSFIFILKRLSKQVMSIGLKVKRIENNKVMVKYIKRFWNTLGDSEKLMAIYLVAMAILILIATN